MGYRLHGDAQKSQGDTTRHQGIAAPAEAGRDQSPQQFFRIEHGFSPF
jgi:hypothetical protein